MSLLRPILRNTHVYAAWYPKHMRPDFANRPECFPCTCYDRRSTDVYKIVREAFIYKGPNLPEGEGIIINNSPRCIGWLYYAKKADNTFNCGLTYTQVKSPTHVTTIPTDLFREIKQVADRQLQLVNLLNGVCAGSPQEQIDRVLAHKKLLKGVKGGEALQAQMDAIMALHNSLSEEEKALRPIVKNFLDKLQICFKEEVFFTLLSAILR
jgi:hypothetical protein